ncbi:hypothetical protein FHY19_003354 [Xanthomonas arboricola]|nr:hypothetical protein [Xanthomonas sp. 4461]
MHPFVESPWWHSCRQGSRNRQAHRTGQLVGCFLESVLSGCAAPGNEKFAACVSQTCPPLGMQRRGVKSWSTHSDPTGAGHALFANMHTDHLDGPLPASPTVAGPYAAWMSRKSLQGRTCGVSCDGGRARTLQPSRRSAALQLFHSRYPVRRPKHRDSAVLGGQGPCSQAADLATSAAPTWRWAASFASRSKRSRQHRMHQPLRLTT